MLKQEEGMGGWKHQKGRNLHREEREGRRTKASVQQGLHLLPDNEALSYVNPF